MLIDQLKKYLDYCALFGLKPQDFNNLQKYLNTLKLNN